MIIELIGLMGAGKTTLYRQAVERLNGRGHSVWTNEVLGELCGSGRLACLRRLWFRTRSSWWSRRLTIVALRHLSRNGRSWRDTLTALRWFLTSLGNRWKARQILAPDQLALIDEGLGQRLFGIFIHDAGEIDLNGVRQYARVQPLPDVLIYLTVDPQVATMRVLTGSKTLPPRFRSLDRVQLRTMFDNAAHALDVLVDEIRRTASDQVRIVVIRSEDLIAARRELDEHIDAILASAQCRPVNTGRRVHQPELTQTPAA